MTQSRVSGMYDLVTCLLTSQWTSGRSLVLGHGARRRIACVSTVSVSCPGASLPVPAAPRPPHPPRPVPQHPSSDRDCVPALCKRSDDCVQLCAHLCICLALSRTNTSFPRSYHERRLATSRRPCCPRRAAATFVAASFLAPIVALSSARAALPRIAVCTVAAALNSSSCLSCTCCLT